MIARPRYLLTPLGTGLRLKELLGLNVGDVSPDGKHLRQRIVLEITKGGRRGEVFLPPRLQKKLERFLSWKMKNLQSLQRDAPLFISTQGRLGRPSGDSRGMQVR